MKITDEDQQLLSVLRENARASTAEIARAIARVSPLSNFSIRSASGISWS